MLTRNTITCVLVAGLATSAATAGGVGLNLWRANITALNGSGVSGTAELFLDGDNLTVTVVATGLEADMAHPMHIHGLVDDMDGSSGDSTTPTIGADTDGDGFVELAEGLPSYGPVILPLTSPPGSGLDGFPTAPGGVINFSQVYDLSDDSVFGDGFDSDNLFPLDFREIVIHGMTVPAGIGAGTDGEVDGTGGYLATLPVAAGEFVLVPAPGVVTIAGLGGALAFRRRR
ncbi:MAG: hypothetical protein CMJ31_06120 [Phycisphaerae bacterium]|nr:hypothetical protein [Phycisphaerae bacterium]